MNKVFILVGTGGFIGSVCRYYCQQLISIILPVVFPYGTLVVNISGCFLIGIIFGLSNQGNVLGPEWRMFLATGFCGGFTTFSTFSLESINLINEGEWLYVSVYVAASLIAGFFFTWLGFTLIKSIL